MNFASANISKPRCLAQSDDPILAASQKMVKEIPEDLHVLEAVIARKQPPKSLYLCFAVYKDDLSAAYVVQKLDGVQFRTMMLGSKDNSSSSCLNLSELSRISGLNLPYRMRCGVLGTKILFAGRLTGKYDRLTRSMVGYPSKNIFSLNTSALGEVSIKPFTPSFQAGKPWPLLLELDGKLYALAGYPEPPHKNPTPFFEVLDSRDGSWSPLPDPPFFDYYGKWSPVPGYPPPRERISVFKGGRVPTERNFNYIIIGHYILASSMGIHGLFYLNLEDPHMEDWRHIPTSLATGFNFGGTNLVADVDEDMEELVMLHYDFSRGLSLYYISRNFEDYIKNSTDDDGLLRPKCISIPNVVPDSVNLPPVENQGCKSRLLHLGGRKFCLIISSFEGPMNVDDWADIPRMSIFSVCFEFDTEMKVIRDKIRHCPLTFDFHLKEEKISDIVDIEMLGAYLI